MTLSARPLPPRQLPPPPVRLVARQNALLIERRRVGQSAGLFVLELDHALAEFRAGQYVAVGLSEPDGMLQRPYSVVTVDRSGYFVELLIRRVEGGELSGRLFELPPGARLRIGPPRGLFRLEPASTGRRLFIGAGTGIAPLLAMLEAAALGEDKVPATLIHGVAYADELLFGDRVDRWRRLGSEIDYRPTVSRPADPRNSGWCGRVGRAEEQLTELALAGMIDAQATAYVCGNPHMVEGVKDELIAFGVPAGAIHCERF